MFDSLADRMKQDQKQEINTVERTIRMIAVVVISVALFGGMYFVVRALG
jgi:cell division protein FtsX